MPKDLAKTERTHEEEVVLEEPLISLETEEERRQRRERSIAKLRLLWDRRSVLARISAVGLVIAALIAFLIPNRYTSTTRLMPPDQGSENGMAMLAALAGKAGSALGGLGAQLLGLKTTGDLFIGILRSRTVQDDLISKFDLRKSYGDKRWEDARKDLAERTDVSQDRKSEIIEISVTDRSPQRAQKMAEEYVAELNTVVTSLNTSSAHRERVFLEGRLNQVQQNLESAEKQFSQFASKNTAIDIQEQGKAMIQAGASLEGQLIAAQTQMEGLRQVFTDNNVRVRETQARIDEIRRQLRKLGGTSESNIGDQGSSGNSKNDAATLYPPIRRLPILGVTYADLYRQTKVQEAVFEALTQEYELAKVEEAKETPSVKVLDPANTPEKKSSPYRLLIMLAGTIIAGGFGIAWLLGEAKWHEIDKDDPGKLLTQEVIHSLATRIPFRSRNGSSRTDNSKNLEKN